MGETEQILISKIYHDTFEEEKKQVVKESSGK